MYITGLFNRDNKFLCWNCKVTGKSITLFQHGMKSKVHKIFITLKNTSLFLIIFISFRFSSRKQKKSLRVMLFHCFLVFDSSFKISNKWWFLFQFFNHTKMFEKWFFKFRNYNILSSCWTHSTTKPCFLAVTNLERIKYPTFYKFLLLLSGDASPNLGSIKKKSDINFTISESRNKRFTSSAYNHKQLTFVKRWNRIYCQ